MGVVHKLTDEVIRFIVQKKTEEPSLSCRKLSQIVSAQFSREVSKSSINAVLKENNLSGSVGRPISLNPPKKVKFSIPQERKQQLFSRTPDETPEQPSEVNNSIDNDLTREPDEGSLTTATAGGATAVHSPAHDAFLEEVEIQREKERQKFGPSMSRMGAAFIHAASLHLGLPETAARLFQQHIGVVSLENMVSACSAMTALRFLGIQNEDELESARTQIVWALNGQQAIEDVKKLWNVISSTKTPKNFQLIATNEIDQQKVSADHFKIIFENNDFLLFDARLASLGRIKSHDAWPICRALELLSGQIISNKQPAIIESVVDDATHEQLKLFLTSFADATIPISKIDIINDRNEKLAEFTSIPKCKRDFILGLDSAHRLFAPLTKTLKWGSFTPWFLPESDTVCYYAVIGSNYLNERFGLKNELAKAVAFSFQKDEPPRTVLISSLKRISSEEILRKFLLRWPGQTQSSGHPGIYINNISIVDSKKFNGSFTMIGVFDYLMSTSLRYLTENIFSKSLAINDVNSLNKTLYELSGRILITQNDLLIRTNPTESDGNRRFFEAAAYQLNRYDIRDLGGRKLIFL